MPNTLIDNLDKFRERPVLNCCMANKYSEFARPEKRTLNARSMVILLLNGKKIMLIPTVLEQVQCRQRHERVQDVPSMDTIPTTAGI